MSGWPDGQRGVHVLQRHGQPPGGRGQGGGPGEGQAEAAGEEDAGQVAEGEAQQQDAHRAGHQAHRETPLHEEDHQVSIKIKTIQTTFKFSN